MSDWDADPPRLTMRDWLTMRAIMAGADIFLAVEAVASTAIEHPEWDLQEKKTWVEWEQVQRSG